VWRAEKAAALGAPLHAELGQQGETARGADLPDHVDAGFACEQGRMPRRKISWSSTRETPILPGFLVYSFIRPRSLLSGSGRGG
jgi:hypothetical protein